MTMSFIDVAQTKDEERRFVAAFARMNTALIKKRIQEEKADASPAKITSPDWDDPEKLSESGISPLEVDQSCREGDKFLHIDVAVQNKAHSLISSFLLTTGLSEKQQKSIFPVLSRKTGRSLDREATAQEVAELNDWLRTAYKSGSDREIMEAYRASVRIDGQLRNITGQIGATGAAIAFIDAIRQLDPNAISSIVGKFPPNGPMNPEKIGEWHDQDPGSNRVKALLLKNGRAIVFASSKDANIFQSLHTKFSTAEEARKAFGAVQNDQKERRQVLHEFAVGEIKTATDPSNLHERLGLASRETQTELRTDRFLMMSILNDGILKGGIQGRQMNNRDLTRFSHVFNLHHCWGWDGGRQSHHQHWQYFLESVREWCGL